MNEDTVSLILIFLKLVMILYAGIHALTFLYLVRQVVQAKRILSRFEERLVVSLTFIHAIILLLILIYIVLLPV
jgi:hypothetical protein